MIVLGASNAFKTTFSLKIKKLAFDQQKSLANAILRFVMIAVLRIYFLLMIYAMKLALLEPKKRFPNIIALLMKRLVK